MIVWTPRLWKWAFVVWWYPPTPWWRLWCGYQWGIFGKKWPPLYAGPLKIASGPR